MSSLSEADLVSQALFAPESEKVVVGCLCTDTDYCYAKMSEEQISLEPLWFSHAKLRRAVEAVIALRKTAKIIDWPLVQTRMVEMGEEDFETHVLLTQAVETVITKTVITQHLIILRDKYLKRLQMEIMIAHRERLLSEMESQDALAMVRADLEKTEIGASAATPEKIETTINERLDNNQQAEVGLLSRWYAWSNLIGSYKFRKIHVVAARPSVGKTTWGLHELQGWAKTGHNVAMISLEMDQEEIYETLAGMESEVDIHRLYKNQCSDEEKAKFKQALKLQTQLPMHITDRSMDINQICDWIMSMKHRKNIEAVVLDYLQIISDTPGMKTKDIREKVNMWMGRLFSTIRRANVHLMLLSQISRAGEAPPNAKPEDRWKFVPKLHHLKESGKIEEDAFHVTLLYNDPQSTVDGQSTVTLIADLAKHRRGPTGIRKFVYEKSRQKISWKGTHGV